MSDIVDFHLDMLTVGGQVCSKVGHSFVDIAMACGVICTKCGVYLHEVRSYREPNSKQQIIEEHVQ